MVISTLVDTFCQENKFPTLWFQMIFWSHDLMEFGHVCIAPGKSSIQYNPGNALDGVS